MPIDTAATLTALRAAATDGRLGALAGRLGIELIVLFGSSITRDDPRDVDLAVGHVHGRSADLLAFLDGLAVMAPGDHVDVLDLDRAGPVARVEALTKGQILYEAGPGVFTRREMFAMGEYLETAHLRDALLRDLAS